jgi:lysozyme
MDGIDKMIAQIKRHEGVKLKPYHCTAGKLTIGVGRNIEDNGISEREAEFLLMNDLSAMADAAKSYEWYADLNEPRKAVIINMLFNMGQPRFDKFVNTKQFLSDGLYIEAAEEMLNSKWAKDVGRRAEELSEQMARGQWYVG